MGRTPLFRGLRRLARGLRAARARELAPDPGRRNLILGGTAALALVPLGCAVPASARRPRARIAVVGAGLAGLVAARELVRAGASVRLFEADTRAGGRVRTLRGRFAEGQRVERGGELIDTGHARLRALVASLGLELDDLGAQARAGEGWVAHVAGERVRPADLELEFAALLPVLLGEARSIGPSVRHDELTPAGIALDRLSLAEWIETRVPGGGASRLGRLLAVAYDVEYGADPGELSALNLVNLLGSAAQPDPRALYGDSDERFRVRGGNDLVPARLAAGLARELETEHVLVAARTLGDGRVRLSFGAPGGARELDFDRVVLALPFALLRAGVDLARLELGPRQREAIRCLGMGRNRKLHVQFARRAWHAAACDGASFTEQGAQCSWEETRAQPGTCGVLNLFRGSRGAELAALGPGAGRQRALAALETALPGIAAESNGLASFDDWPSAPFALGSYSHWRPGQCARFAGAEGERAGNVFFAGEHTSLEFQGFLEGAVESGERAARELLESLRPDAQSRRERATIAAPTRG